MMNRYILILLLVAVPLSCLRDYSPEGVNVSLDALDPTLFDGLIDQDGVSPGNDGLTEVADGLAESDIVLEASSGCETAWKCVVDTSCDLSWDYDSNPCLQKCTDGIPVEETNLFLSLIDCSKQKCSQEVMGPQMVLCTFEKCTSDWLSCVEIGGGDSCGDMRHCLITECEQENSTACLSACLRHGSAKEYSEFEELQECGSSGSWAEPTLCADRAVACYLGSGNANLSLSDSLTCQYDCYSEYCGALPNCQWEPLLVCTEHCLFGLGNANKKDAEDLGPCMFPSSHEQLLDSGTDPYDRCLKPALDILGDQGFFGKCSSAMTCLFDSYNYFKPKAEFLASSFGVSLGCIEDMPSVEHQRLSAAIDCLAEAWQGVDLESDPSGVWDSCEVHCDQ